MLEILKLKKVYTNGFLRKKVFSTQSVSFQLRQGEILGLVGPSGCGKTTVARMIAGLESPTDGKLMLDGSDLNFRKTENRFRYRKQVQMISQHPELALDPKQTAGNAVIEVLLYHRLASSRKKALDMTREWFEKTGLAWEIAKRFPREMSGGQAQRVAMIRALSLSPRFLIADEPTSMLDLSVQTMILRLIIGLKEKKKTGVLLITHDMDVVNALCDRVITMNTSEQEAGDVFMNFKDERNPP